MMNKMRTTFLQKQNNILAQKGLAKNKCLAVNGSCLFHHTIKSIKGEFSP